jgi:hypothetical protein
MIAENETELEQFREPIAISTVTGRELKTCGTIAGRN